MDRRPLSCFAACLALGSLLVLAAPVRADDGKEGEKPLEEKPAAGKAGEGPSSSVPSPLAELQEEHLEENTEPEDPIEYLRSFRDWVREHERPPPKDGTNKAVYEVWRSVLKPRARRMTNRIDRLMTRRYWLPENGKAQRVKPDKWSTFVRELGGLITELDGAWSRYRQVVLRDRGGRLETSGNRVYDSVYTGYGLPYRRWHRGVVYRQGVGLRLRHRELNSYWHLMRRYRLGWNWRIAECRNCEAREKELEERADKIAQSQKLVDTTRDTLRQQMLALQVLAGAMQAQQEVHIAEQLEELPKDHVLREPAENLLTALRRARLEAERYDGDSSSEYAQLLRDWVRAFKAGRALLEKEAKALEETDDE